jgi:hypothetical protein
MRRRAIAALAAVGALAVVAVGSYALAGPGKSNVKADRLSGYLEVPSVSSGASGEFKARITDSAAIEYELSYSGLEGAVQQAHIHFGQRSVNGGITVFLCTNLGNGPAGTQACPQSGRITGTIQAAHVLNTVFGGAAQGIGAGELAELIAAIRAGRTYVNVHSEPFPGGEVRGQINDQNQRDD